MVVGNGGIDNYIIVSHSVPRRASLNVISNCRFSLFSSSETLFNLCSRHHESGASAQSVGPVGNFYSGITSRWPGYCCLWYLLVKFLNQYNISPRSSWEWKPAAAHLILEPACALCSAAKLGSWPTWCGIIAAEVRCEQLDECWWMAVWWSASPAHQETFNNDRP